MPKLRLRLLVPVVVFVLVLSAGCGGGRWRWREHGHGRYGRRRRLPDQQRHRHAVASVRRLGARQGWRFCRLGTDEITIDSDVTLPAGPHDVWAYNFAGDESPFRTAYEPTVPTQTAGARASRQSSP